MKEEKLFEIMADINDNYIADAHKNTTMTRKGAWLRWVSVAACLCVVVIGIITILPFGNNSISTLSVLAKELGKEEYQFGVALPQIIYSDYDRVIFYDFRGIYVYSFTSEELVGYADFRELNMDRTQGDNPTFVGVTADGCYVRFYNVEKKYIYDVKENEYTEVAEFGDSLENQYQISSIIFGEENAISEDQITYIGKDGSYLAVEIDLDNLEDGVPKYKNMYILRKDGDVTKKYYVFGE